ncbi:MAG: WYL domain-containing protein, partial [Actinobacteria bacterium]|nr:WYL domain-containing protein [Actinomycetota bacterium]
VTAERIHQTIPGYGQANYESFKRMFERDKEDLHEEGIPIELVALDAWGEEEGYMVRKERYYLPELDLQPDEIASLWIAAGLLRMNDDSSARTAIMKLSGDTPPDSVSTPSWLAADLGLTSENLPKAFDAVAEKKSIYFNYRRSQEKQRHLDPYGLVHRKGFWYLVGNEHPSDEVRSFRLDRIAGELRLVEPSRPGPEFEIPKGFDPEKALAAPPFAQGESSDMVATVRFDPSTAWWVARSTAWLRIEWSDDDSATAEVDVSDVQGFVSWLLSHGEGATLLGPQVLIDEVRRRLEKVCG